MEGISNYDQEIEKRHHPENFEAEDRELEKEAEDNGEDNSEE